MPNIRAQIQGAFRLCVEYMKDPQGVRRRRFRPSILPAGGRCDTFAKVDPDSSVALREDPAFRLGSLSDA
jgi:hypothetical protein